MATIDFGSAFAKSVRSMPTDTDVLRIHRFLRGHWKLPLIGSRKSSEEGIWEFGLSVVGPTGQARLLRLGGLPVVGTMMAQLHCTLVLGRAQPVSSTVVRTLILQIKDRPKRW